MANGQLNVGTSVVDFLKSQKKPSTFTARRGLFEAAGLNTRLGDYSGSEAQNRALLKNLQSSASNSAGQTPATNAVNTLASSLSGTPSSLSIFGGQPIQQATQAIQQAAQQTTAQPATAARTLAQIQPQPAPATSTVQQAAQTAQTAGRFDLTQIPQVEVPTAEQILERARGSTDVQFAEEEAKIARERLAADVPRQIRALKSDLSSRGLVLSGFTNEGERLIRNAELAANLDIDVRLAKILGNAVDVAQVELGKEIEDVIAAAQDQRKAEVDFLNSIGLAVDPSTGELYPTLEAIRLEETQRRGIFQDQLDAARLALDEARLGISQENLALAQQRVDLAERQANQVGQLSADAEKKLVGIVGIEQNVALLEGLLDQIPARGGVLARIQGLRAITEAAAGENEPVQNYNNIRDALVGPLARVISGEVGVLTDRDIARADGLLPKVTDTENERNNKIDVLRETLNNRKETYTILSTVGSGALLNPGGDNFIPD